MKQLLPLLLLSSCGIEQQNMAADLVSAQPEKDRLREHAEFVRAHVDPVARPYLFDGRPTGSWLINANAGPHVANGYVVYMSDTNRVAPRYLNVLLQRSGDHTVSMSVNVAGCDPAKSEGKLFEGPKWIRATPAKRAATVLDAMRADAALVSRACNADIGTLADELATFSEAFASFDQWEP